MSAADDLKDKLKDLTEVYEEIAKKEAENQEYSADHDDKSGDNNEDGLIKSHIVNYPHRRYYLDLKKNRRALNLPGPKAFRIDNRTLYFDSVSNRYGVFLRISQVWASSRTAITIPERSLNRFRDIINELAERISSSSVKEEEDSGDNEKDVAHSTEETLSKTPNSDTPAD
ncbi:hypothetical protein AAHC03_05068 [Spirometra sp. Aus1]